LFDHNRGLIYPDFISRDLEARVIADVMKSNSLMEF